MSTRILVAGVSLGLAACALPFRGSNGERKSACDRIAAQAIQTTSLSEAENRARQAADCYGRARSWL